MKPTLNKSDVELIRSALKPDFDNLEKKVNVNLRTFITNEIERLRLFMYEYFKEIKLEDTLKNHEQRITELEAVTPGIPGH